MDRERVLSLLSSIKRELEILLSKFEELEEI